MRAVLLFIFLFFISACSYKYPYSTIKDERELKQNALAYVNPKQANKILINQEYQKLIDEKYNEKFFEPWARKKAQYRKEDISWGFRIYKNRKIFGENKKPISKKWLKQLEKIANLESYPNFNKTGITVVNSNLRVLPTHKPVFYDFNKAGEGFPFDYMQNSAIYAGTPVFISHVSKDGEWFLVEAPFAAGWVPAKDLAIVDREFIENYKRERYIAFIKDEISVFDENRIFRFKGKIGSIYPLIGEDEKNYHIYIPVKDTDGTAVLVLGKIPKETAVVKPIPITEQNIAKIINELLNQTYGWGGLYRNRDCSATLKDLFTPFGIWLPRNSTAQAKAGLFISLKDLSIKQKEKLISESGFPFMTLLWMRGHIMLYIGKKDDNLLIFHNFWGIKTKDFWGKEGRFVVGKAVITTLRPEGDLPNVDKEKGVFLKRLLGMSILMPPRYMVK
jgi:hypothetical protein